MDGSVTISWAVVIQLVSMVATAFAVWAAIRTDISVMKNDQEHLTNDVEELKSDVKKHGEILGSCNRRHTDIG